MKTNFAAIVAASALLAVAGCSKPKTESTTTTTTEASPAMPDAAAPAAPAAMAAAPAATDATPAGGDLHNNDPTVAASTAAKP